MTHIVQLLDNLWRSKNVKAFTTEDIALVNELINLGEGHMEQKSITRLEKIFDRAVGMVGNKDFKSTENVSFGFSLSAFRTRNFKSNMRYYTEPTYEYYTFRFGKVETADDTHAIDKLIECSELFTELADWFYHVKEKQWMRNGVIPKSLQKAQTPKEVIKGMLDVAFQGAITELVDELDAVERAYWAEVVKNGKKVSSITYNPINESRYSDTEIEKRIEGVIQNSIATFTYRLCDKLGGFKPASEIKEINSDVSDERSFTIQLKFANNDQVTLLGKKVWNTSPLGTPFMQFPITFHNMIVNGSRIENSEVNFKKYFRGEVE